MSNLKKNKRVFIVFLAVLSCLSVFLLVREKYIENTTKKIFHDKGQKTAGPSCKDLFDDSEGEPLINVYYESSSVDNVYYLTCEVSKKTLNAINKPSGVSFELTPGKNTEISRNNFKCRASNVNKVKITVTDEIEWDVKYNLTEKLKLEGTKYCAKSSGGRLNDELYRGSSGGNKGEDDKEAAEYKKKNNSEIDMTFDDWDTEEITGSDETGLADDLTQEDEEDQVGEVAYDKVQVNGLPWKDTAKRGSKSDKSTFYSFRKFQEEMGWKGKYSSYEQGEAETYNQLYKGEGNHEKYTDSNSETNKEYRTHGRKNIIDDAKKEEKQIKWEDTGGKNTKGTIKLKCNYDLSQKQIEAIQNNNYQFTKNENGDLTNYYYDQSNTTFFYGRQEKVESTDRTLKYIAHTEGGPDSDPYVTEEQTIKCKRVCQEIVKVEYGPPVYIDAGMCFEYRVRATSIVRCKSNAADIKKPKTKKAKICAPYPVCIHGSTVYKQGGPNEDFEACINKCDGGRYSEHCSNKCYQEVYGTPETALQQLANLQLSEGITATPTSTSTKYGCPKGVGGGQYYRSGSTVKYCMAKDQDPLTCRGGNGADYDAGYWYNDVTHRGASNATSGFRKYGITHWFGANYASNQAGFVKRCTGSGLCGDKCHWAGGCGDKSKYLIFSIYANGNFGKCTASNNYGVYTDKDTGEKIRVCNVRDQIKADNHENRRRYRNAKKACKAKTTCTTSSAEFAISFKYSTEKESVVVKFPYSTGSTTKDKLGPPSTNKASKVDDNITTLLSFGGCYRSSNKKRWYQVEWTFPATYIVNKKRERVYTKPAQDGTYNTYKGTVCLPQNLKDTNPAWGKKYYEAAYNGKTVTSKKTSSTLAQLYNDWMCTFKEEKSIENYKNSSSANSTSDGYNIKAEGMRFGFFRWDFNIWCFYSLLNDPSKVTLKNGTSLKSTQKECYDIPDDDKKKTIEDEKIQVADPKDPLLQNNTNNRIQLRGDGEIPFNWKAEAKLVHQKAGHGYNINPAKLLERIKADGNSGKTFDDNTNLDFRFKLTPSIISRIKKYNAANGYSLSNAKVISNEQANEAGIIYYRSTFLRNTIADSKLVGNFDAYAGYNSRHYLEVE
ncbi:MAG: hypothetical protein IJI43_04430 [Bacilli bacterium]|nr:hypothetical protein [Bacilli bacterium]